MNLLSPLLLPLFFTPGGCLKYRFEYITLGYWLGYFKAEPDLLVAPDEMINLHSTAELRLRDCPGLFLIAVLLMWFL